MATELTEVEFAGHTVEVPKGGYYDRFRSNPDLDEVAQDPAVGNIDWFRRIPKVQVSSRVGPLWAPNFYYRASIVQANLLAPFDRLAAMLPAPLEPLRAVPGFGVTALTFFSYAVCDNDPYDEVSVAVVIRKPGRRGPVSGLLPELELLDAVRHRNFYAHVLALPVTTEIARVRGVNGYQLPKWRTDINVDISDAVRAEIDGPAGQPDVTLQAPLPEFTDVPAQSRMGTNTMIHLVDGEWHQTSVQSNTLSYAQRSFPRDVSITRHGGPLSDLLNGLGASRILSLEVTRNAQLALNLPRPLKAFG
ncbi:acetoacetate decarboxylase [Mycolicibacterium sp.]|uniref:acetoacetate decarboxylase n=1 Tax=Mycolicibacterium sp. TaxID=2320850 RepID=UPI0037CC8C75